MRAYEGTADMRALRSGRHGLRAGRATPTRRTCVAVAIAAVIGVAELVSAAASTSAATGLVAAYGFDEGSGTTVTDASGNGNTGKITNATWTASGKYGKALRFNGANALVTVPDKASLHLSRAMTLEAWVNPSVVDASWRDVIYKGNDNFYLEATSTNGSVPDAGVIAGGSYADAFAASALPASTWSFLTETYDGSALRLYVNGTQVASTAHTGAIATSTNPLQIGGDSIYGQNFTGLIDEVRVYNVALTAAQIQADQATPVNPSGPSQPGTLTATAVSSSEVDLSWGASTGTLGVAGYQVERCQGAGCTSFTQIAAPAGTATSYQDTSVSASTSYSYRVRAVDSAGETGPYSNIATATTGLAITPGTAVVTFRQTAQFAAQGPDFEGQIRRLRSGDGIYFTKPGARKLAHYVEREIQRTIANRALPVALPAPEPTPATPGTRPGGPAQRPLVGPVVPLTILTAGQNDLLGASPTRPAADPVATRVLTKGETIPAASGRADDFSWPRNSTVVADPPPPAVLPEPAQAKGPAAGSKAGTAKQPQVQKRTNPAGVDRNVPRPPGAIKPSASANQGTVR